MQQDPHITAWLARWHEGDDKVGEDLFLAVYDELRKIAGAAVYKASSKDTMQATALVNEAFMKLAKQDSPFENRKHFYSLAAIVMRRVLVDYFREKGRAKRGDGEQVFTLQEFDLIGEDRNLDVLALDDALKELEQMDPRQAQIVQLRFFTGLNVEETADTLELSPRTVKREWRMAKAWLHGKLTGA
jgi:RNA polymerase sigma factor (TIGR02999 family)